MSLIYTTKFYIVMKRQSQCLLRLMLLLILTQTVSGQAYDEEVMRNKYPWCIVAYDSLERTPTERIQMIKDLGFTKYAYDWRDKHLDDTLAELQIAKNNGIEIVSIWLWLNAKRDSLGSLSKANERMFNIIQESGIKTTFWVSLSPNFFSELSDEQSLKKATELINFVSKKAAAAGCEVALYNHTGWFANPYNQIRILKALPQHNLQLVYNFHHSHNDIDNFPNIAKAILPHLSAVNLNGMEKDSKKILTIGAGKYEMQMINTLKEFGFNGPWGIMGHVENVDVRKVLIQNIEGLKSL